MFITVYIPESTNDYRKSPFFKWFYKLDTKTRAIMRIRIDRLKIGNSGNCDPVGNGVQELRIHYGPGYRIYFGEKGSTKVILLIAGDKSTQDRDIDKAKAYWSIYNKTSKEAPYEE